MPDRSSWQTFGDVVIWLGLAAGLGFLFHFAMDQAYKWWSNRRNREK